MRQAIKDSLKHIVNDRSVCTKEAILPVHTPSQMQISTLGKSNCPAVDDSLHWDTHIQVVNSMEEPPKSS